MDNTKLNLLGMGALELSGGAEWAAPLDVRSSSAPVAAAPDGCQGNKSTRPRRREHPAATAPDLLSGRTPPTVSLRPRSVATNLKRLTNI